MSISASQHRVGSLVRARGRDWIVLPPREPEVLRLRPLTGTDEEGVGLFVPLEGDRLEETQFAPPDPAAAGDATGARLLFDAVRLSLRSGAAPFRSLGRISVIPRPYQFVPLIMGLRLDRVRLLIADDVGVGKTIEALLVARELLDRGLARRLAVICPPYLCDQWERELREKFAIEARVVQPSRIARLERELPRPDLSIFQHFPYLVASIDFIKSDRHRDHFLRHAPDLVIVDEAHGAARPRGEQDRVQHQRYEFIRALANDPARHLILVTATPHSGIEESFRSLLGLLSPAFDVDPDNPTRRLDRKPLIPHVVQRRRRDVQRWLGADTHFPDRVSTEVTYTLSPPYQSLFEQVLAYCRESVQTRPEVRAQQQRVRHWAAIALLRCVLSSPEAAVAVLSERRRRVSGDGEAAPEAVDETYRPQVLDPADEEQSADYVPSAPIEEAEPQLSDAERRRLGEFLRRARQLAGPERDRKLAAAAESLRSLLRDGFRPIVYCRFIATAKYLADSLPRLLGDDFPRLHFAAITGELGEEERRERIGELARERTRILVATDCMSEGINLQEDFDAVLHYDLPWNPNRLEQREGRVDRFGQQRPEVRAVVLYGTDNPVDLVVLDVLIRKAREIRRSLGIAVPIPAEAEHVVEAVVDNVLLRGPGRGAQLQLALSLPDVSRLHEAWEEAAREEDRHRTYFAQHGIKPDEVAREMQVTDAVLGDPGTVRRFLANAAQRFGGELRATQRDHTFELEPGELRGRLASRVTLTFPLTVTLDRLKDPNAEFVGRTHPVVAAFADAVIAKGLAPRPDDRFARCGAMFTDVVTTRTALMLLRFRYLLTEETEEFAEEIVVAAFRRADGDLRWLEPFGTAAQELLDASRPAANMPPEERTAHVTWALDQLAEPRRFAPLVDWRVAELREAHARVRELLKVRPPVITPHVPLDIVGCYVLVPAKEAGQ